MALFGHRGNLSFTAITQPWLRETAKIWALADLPRRRGRSGGDKTRHYLSSLALLSASLRQRADRGEDPAALGRADIEVFLNRLGYLHAAGEISELTRVLACREVRKLLTTARQLGATRPGGPAAGLSDQFALHRDDMPDEPEHGEPGRDLPPEIMRQICSQLAHPGRTSHPHRDRDPHRHRPPPRGRRRAAAGLPGQRPRRCTRPGLRQPQGAPARAAAAHPARPPRRLIRAQQQRVRDRFPGTPASELKLLPTGWANRDGRRPLTVSALSAAHRDWLTSLPPLLLDDGGEFDKDRAVPYAYRHTYAQRHADAGVPIDVLAELLDHRNLNVTRGYYRVGEDRRRGAVDKVTAMQFDRHGNRIWRARPRAAGRRARPLRGRLRRRPLRHLHRAVQRRRRRERLPGPVPLRRLRPLPHRRVLPARPDRLPRRPAPHPRTARRRHRHRRLGTRPGGPRRPGDHRDPAAHQPHQRRHRRPAPRTTGPASTKPSPSSASTARSASACPASARPHRPSPTAKGQAHDQPQPAARTGASARTETMRKGRQADSARRRQRVLAALDRASRQRDRDQRLRHRPRRRRRPHLPLPAPRPAREDPRLPKQPRPPPAKPQAPPSPAHRCRPTCSPPTNAPSASTPASASSNNGCPRPSASRPGENPDSAPPPTSTRSTRKSPTSSSKPSTCACSSKNATTNSPPPAPPTAS